MWEKPSFGEKKKDHFGKKKKDELCFGKKKVIFGQKKKKTKLVFYIDFQSGFFFWKKKTKP